MEFANQLVLTGVLLYFVGFITALVLPKHWTNPIKVVISCNDCDWKSKTFKDRGKDKTNPKLVEHMKALHRDHYKQAHPDLKWEDHSE